MAIEYISSFLLQSNLKCIFLALLGTHEDVEVSWGIKYALPLNVSKSLMKFPRWKLLMSHISRNNSDMAWYLQSVLIWHHAIYHVMLLWNTSHTISLLCSIRDYYISNLNGAKWQLNPK